MTRDDLTRIALVHCRRWHELTSILRWEAVLAAGALRMEHWEDAAHQKVRAWAKSPRPEELDLPRELDLYLERVRRCEREIRAQEELERAAAAKEGQ